MIAPPLPMPETVCSILSPYFFGACLAISHLRVSTRNRERLTLSQLVTWRPFSSLISPVESSAILRISSAIASVAAARASWYFSRKYGLWYSHENTVAMVGWPSSFRIEFIERPEAISKQNASAHSLVYACSPSLLLICGLIGIIVTPVLEIACGRYSVP